MLKQLWCYRSFVIGAIRNEFAVRFARSRFGVFWMVLNPLAQVCIYAAVLSKVLGAEMPGIDSKYAYAIYLMAGQLAWTTFSDVILRSQTMFIDNASLLSKISFPRLLLPLVTSGVVITNSMIFFMVIVVIFTLLGHFPGWPILGVPVLLLLTLCLGQAIGLIVAVLNVFYRDVGQVVPIVLQLGFWMTPIVYRPKILPDAISDLLAYNPMLHVVTAFQNVMVFDQPPQLGALAVVTAFSVMLMAFALFLVRRASPELVEAL